MQSLAMRNSDRHSPMQTPLSNSKKEPLKSRAQAYVKGDNGAVKHHKQCHCKQTKCLKLYCECFASGYYCNGCNCADCHNNIDNEAARQVAAEIILERNPNAFRSKIAHGPHSIQKIGVEVRDIVKHKRGCHCKKTGCIKRYCECFQAHIHCSENCKCLDCKNKEGYEDRLATLKDNYDTKTCNEKVYAVSSTAIGLTDHSFSLASSKRKGQGPIDANEKDTKMQMNPLITSGSRTACSIISQDQVHSSTTLYSLFAYRSLLAEIIHPHAIKKFCSRLVAELDAAKKHPGIDLYVWELAPDDHSNENEVTIDTGFSKVASAGGQEGMLLSPVAEALLFDKKGSVLPGPATPDRNMKHENNGYVYVNQERLILTNFQNFLTKLISYRDMKDRLCTSSDI